MNPKRTFLLWASVAAAAVLPLWLLSLSEAARLIRPGDSPRMLAVIVLTNLSIISAFFGLAALAHRAALIRGLDDRSTRGRVSLILVGILSAMAGFSVGHIGISVLWDTDPGGWIRRSLGLTVTGVPIILAILLIVNSFLSLSFSRIRSVRMRTGVIFAVLLVPVTILQLPRFYPDIDLLMDLWWFEWLYPLRSRVETPANEFTLVYVERDDIETEKFGDIAEAFLAQHPAEVIILAPIGLTVDEASGSLTVPGFTRLFSHPPADTRLTIGYTRLWDLERMQEQYPGVTFRKTMNFFRFSEKDRLVYFRRESTDPDEDLLAYMLETGGDPVTETLSRSGFLLNLHGDRNRHLWPRPAFDLMHVTGSADAAGWKATYFPVSAELPRSLSYAVDPGTGRLIAADTSYRSAAALAGLAGRRVIIDLMPLPEEYWNNFLGVCYATAIVNARHGLEFNRMGSTWYAALTLVVLILILISFVRLRALMAQWVSLLMQTVIAVVLVLLFLESNILISPFPAFWVSSLLVMEVLFIVAFTRERREALEERSRLQAELSAAREMQSSLLPAADPVVPGFDIAGHCQPASEVGGDFYDYVWLDRRRTKLGIAVADVSGKAMKAAMTAVMTSGMLYDAAQRSRSPREILSAINGPLYIRSDKRVFTAMLMSTLDVKGTTAVTVSNAGQTPPLLVRNGVVTPIQAKGVKLPLGIKEALRYPQVRKSLRPGDLLLFYTDGLTEAMRGEEQYGQGRLDRFLVEHAEFSARQILDALLADVRSFTGEGPQSDDLTMVVVKVG